MGNIFLNLEFNDNEALKAAEEIEETARELREKVYNFQHLLNAEVPSEESDGK